MRLNLARTRAVAANFSFFLEKKLRLPQTVPVAVSEPDPTRKMPEVVWVIFFRSRLYLYPQGVYWLPKMQAVSHKHSLGEVSESWMLILVCNGGLNPEPCDSHLQPGRQNQSIKAIDECDRSRAVCVAAS